MQALHWLSWHQPLCPEQKRTAPAASHLAAANHLLPINPATRPPLSQFKWRKWARRMLLGELAFFCLWAVSFFTFTVLFQASRGYAIYVAADMADAADSWTCGRAAAQACAGAALFSALPTCSPDAFTSVPCLLAASLLACIVTGRG